ncbi:MAG: DUF6516 family protein [Chloroflexota bacterium]
MLPSFAEYCQLLADLPQQFPCIRTSDLRAYTIGKYIAEVEGQVVFDGGYVLSVWELLDLSTRTIRKYSYELDRHSARIWWYDPMAHPENPLLRSTFPHHNHVNPNIKRNRLPAPGLSFTNPNLPFLIQEIEKFLR